MSKSKYEVFVLFDGYSKSVENGMMANCSCTLIKGPNNVIVDTMTAWDGEKLIQALKDKSINCSDINYVVCTHGHSDHIGCNYLFPGAIHIVGYGISQKTFYQNHDFGSGEEYVIDEYLRIIPTPGHTLQDVSVVVETKEKGTVVIAGDLFENQNDIHDDTIWILAGCDSEELQVQNRARVLEMADWIVPGHGSIFNVNNLLQIETVTLSSS